MAFFGRPTSMDTTWQYLLLCGRKSKLQVHYQPQTSHVGTQKWTKLKVTTKDGDNRDTTLQCFMDLFVWLRLVVNDHKFLTGTVFFSHTNQAAVLLYEPATIRISQPNMLLENRALHVSRVEIVYEYVRAGRGSALLFHSLLGEQQQRKGGR